MPIDVETQDLADVLANHGYRAERPTFFIWEAVTQYLTEAGVRKTFDFLATAAPGSHLVSPMSPSGRALPVSEIERSVCARRI